MTRKTKGIKNMALSITFILWIMMMSIVSFADLEDTSEHWAEEAIQEWLAKGFEKDYSGNTFQPQEEISRAEFMALINEVFYFTQETEIVFQDVNTTAWYYGSVKKAIAAGYIEGYPDKRIAPENPITRQEAAIIIAKVKDLELNSEYNNSFIDKISVADWSNVYVGAVVKAGIMSGYPDGSFQPRNYMTRAEAIVVLNNTLATPYIIYDQAGTFGPKTGMEILDTSVVIKADGVVLENLHITGDLIVAEEVGTGDVTLTNITIDGQLYLRGGGTNSIHIIGGKYKNIVVQRTSSGNIRIVGTNVDGLKVVIAENAKGQGIVLEGSFDNIRIDAPNVMISTQGSTSIGEMNVSSSATDSNIRLGENTVVTSMEIEAKMNVTGKGQIKSATVYVDEITFESAPVKLNNEFTTEVPPFSNVEYVSHVTVSPKTMALTVGGGTGTITAEVVMFKDAEPASAPNLMLAEVTQNTSSDAITWISSNVSVATVSNGVVTPVSAGTVNVVATSVLDTSKSATCFVTVSAPVAPAVNATVPSVIMLAVGGTNPVGGVTNVAIPAANTTDTTGTVTNWVTGTADTIKFNVTDGGSAVSTILINGSVYTSGDDYTVTSTANLSIVVRTSENGKTTVNRTFVVAVTAPMNATAPSAVTLTLGSTNPVGGVTNVVLPPANAVDTTGAITNWVAGTADTIKFTVTDSGSAVSTIQINGGVYNSGDDHTLASTADLTIVVTTSENGKTTVNRTFTVTVTAAVDASAPSAVILALGATNPVGGLTNVALPAANAVDTTGAVTDWVTGTADTIKLTVTDSGSAVSTIEINGGGYTSGEDYTLASTADLTIVVTTSENGKTTVNRTFTVTVTAAVDAITPSDIILAVGNTNPVGGVTNVNIPAANDTDTSGKVTSWVTGTADTIKFTVTDSGSAVSTIEINGGVYTSGDDYTLASTADLTIIVYTTETGKTPVTRTFTISVTAGGLATMSAVPSEPMTEINLSTMEIILTITGDTLIDPDILWNSIVLNNPPPGSEIATDIMSSELMIEYLNETSIKITMWADATDYDVDVTNFSITLSGSELSGGQSLTSNNMTVTAIIE